MYHSMQSWMHDHLMFKLNIFLHSCMRSFKVVWKARST